MEKLCIDVRGFSEEKKKRVQDAFFELGYEWLNGGQYHKYLKDDDASCTGGFYGGFELTRSDESDDENTTYPELMRKAGLDESDPDAVEEQAPPKKVGSLTLEVETDLQSVISDYLFLLDSIKDPYARGVIKSQLTDLTDLQYKQLTGEKTNA